MCFTVRWTYLQLAGEVAEEQNVNITGRVVTDLSFGSFFGMEVQTHSACKAQPRKLPTKYSKSNKRLGPPSPSRDPPHPLPLD